MRRFQQPPHFDFLYEWGDFQKVQGSVLIAQWSADNATTGLLRCRNSSYLSCRSLNHYVRPIGRYLCLKGHFCADSHCTIPYVAQTVTSFQPAHCWISFCVCVCARIVCAFRDPSAFAVVCVCFECQMAEGQFKSSPSFISGLIFLRCGRGAEQDQEFMFWTMAISDWIHTQSFIADIATAELEVHVTHSLSLIFAMGWFLHPNSLMCNSCWRQITLKRAMHLCFPVVLLLCASRYAMVVFRCDAFIVSLHMGFSVQWWYCISICVLFPYPTWWRPVLGMYSWFRRDFPFNEIQYSLAIKNGLIICGTCPWWE